jgi:hypothetical protein
MILQKIFLREVLVIHWLCGPRHLYVRTGVHGIFRRQTKEEMSWTLDGNKSRLICTAISTRCRTIRLNLKRRLAIGLFRDDSDWILAGFHRPELICFLSINVFGFGPVTAIEELRQATWASARCQPVFELHCHRRCVRLGRRTTPRVPSPARVCGVWGDSPRASCRLWGRPW